MFDSSLTVHGGTRPGLSGSDGVRSSTDHTRSGCAAADAATHVGTARERRSITPVPGIALLYHTMHWCCWELEFEKPRVGFELEPGPGKPVPVLLSRVPGHGSRAEHSISIPEPVFDWYQINH